MVYQRLDAFFIDPSEEDLVYFEEDVGLSGAELDAYFTETYPELSHVGDDGMCATNPEWYYADLEDEADGWGLDLTDQYDEYDCSGDLYTFT